MGSQRLRFGWRLAACVGLLAFCCVRPLSAGERKVLELRGEVFSEDDHPVKVRSMHVHLHGNTTPFRAASEAFWGKFKFTRVPLGSYTLVVAGPGLGQARQTVDMAPSFADSKGRIYLKIVLHPDVSGASRQLTVSARELSVPASAMMDYERAMKELEGNNDRRVERAIEHLERAIKKAPHFVVALNHLGTIYYQKRDFSKAEGCFRRALEADGNAYEPLVNLGGTLLDLDRFGEALVVNENAALARPSDPLANAQLGMNLFALRRYDEAITYLRRAKELDASHFSHPQITLAEIYMRLGQREAAVAELREFARLHPDHPMAARIRETLNQPAPAK